MLPKWQVCVVLVTINPTGVSNGYSFFILAKGVLTTVDLTEVSNVAELLQRDPGFNNYGFNRGLKQRYMSDFRFSNYGFNRGLKRQMQRPFMSMKF